MSEDRRRRWDFDARIRKNFIAALKAKTRANELGEEIDRREWRERAETYFKWLSDARTSLVNEVSSCRCLHTDERRRWCRRLEEMDLASSGTGSELAHLLTEIKNRRQAWSLLGGDVQRPSLPEWLRAHIPWAGSSPDSAQQSPDPVELMLTQRAVERNREFKQQAQENVRVLASMVSSLEHLITLHQGYRQARSRS